MPDRSPTPAPRFAVIGGGIAGLAAAHRLRQLVPSAELRLFEAGPRLGGPLATRRDGDLVLEQGADSFLTRDPIAADLCRELGLGAELIPTSADNRRALVVLRGRLERVPEGFVLMQPHEIGGILRSPALSWPGKLRLLAEPLVPRRFADAAVGDDESVASFATRRLGREAFERLVEPLLAGIYVADAEQLSLAATMPEFLAAERARGSLWKARRTARDETAATGAHYGKFLALARGLESLVDAIAATLPRDAVQLGTAVRALGRAAPGQWLVSAGDRVESFHGVILATPATNAAELLHAVDGQLRSELAQITAASSAVVTLVYRRDQIAHPLDGFGFVVPRVERRQILAASFPSVKFPGRGPTDLAPVRAFMGGALQRELLELDDARLIAIAGRELGELIGARGAPQEAFVARWPHSMPQYRVGHRDLVARIERRVALHKGLEVAGASYRGVGIPQCLQSGRVAAERLASSVATLAEASLLDLDE